MITVICGEDSSQSREYFHNLIQSHIEKGSEIRAIKANEIININKWQSTSPSLFSQETVFTTENLNKFLSKRKNPEFLTFVENLVSKKNISIISWEDSVSARFLKFPKTAAVKEFKLSSSIFKLMDFCYPGNLKNFILQLNEVSDNSDELFIFIMLSRHMRSILQVSLGELPAKLQPWQIAKLKQQAKLWKTEKLVDFYHGLYNIDIGLKTSSNPFSVLESLEVLACYYL